LGNVKIGSNCIIAHNVYFGDRSHIYEVDPYVYIKDQDLLYSQKFNSNSYVEIHDDVFLGSGVFIGPNVVIGKGAIVGANSVITKNVLPYSFVVGANCIIKHRIDLLPQYKLSCSSKSSFPYLYSGIGYDLISLRTSSPSGGLKFIDNTATFLLEFSQAKNIEIILGSTNHVFPEKFCFSINQQQFNAPSLSLKGEYMHIKIDLTEIALDKSLRIFKDWDFLYISSEQLNMLFFVSIVVS